MNSLIDDLALMTVEENEFHSPSARKLMKDKSIHVSQYVLGEGGPLTISYFGRARIGTEQCGNAMPLPLIIKKKKTLNKEILYQGVIQYRNAEKDINIIEGPFQRSGPLDHLGAINATVNVDCHHGGAWQL